MIYIVEFIFVLVHQESASFITHITNFILTMSRMSTKSVPLPYFSTKQSMATKESKPHTHNPFLGYLTRIHGATKQ